MRSFVIPVPHAKQRIPTPAFLARPNLGRDGSTGYNSALPVRPAMSTVLTLKHRIQP
jgi:hypothetical protein